MTPKQKEVHLFVQLNPNTEVKIWYTRQDFKEPFLTGTIDCVIGTYLMLKKVSMWNGNRHETKTINIAYISKIIKL